jgi:3'(2'), 5'-bisphosphate nucleotidase
MHESKATHTMDKTVPALPGPALPGPALPGPALPGPALPGIGLSAERLADALLPVVLAAARTQLHYYNSGVAIETKADTTPVTIADQQSEALILAEFARIAPRVPVVAEEAMAAGIRPAASEVFLLVDPLDGTREFISGRGEFTINIALIAREVPVFGLVYAPVAGDFFVTTTAGAVRATVAADANATNVDALGAKPIQVRSADLAGVTALVSRSHMTPEKEAMLKPFKIAERKSAGSSLKFCLIAAGEADIYPRAGRTNEWDTAAGDAVLRAAGGMVTTPDGVPLRYGKSADEYRNPDYIAWGKGLWPNAR